MFYLGKVFKSCDFYILNPLSCTTSVINRIPEMKISERDSGRHINGMIREVHEQTEVGTLIEGMQEQVQCYSSESMKGKKLPARVRTKKFKEQLNGMIREVREQMEAWTPIKGLQESPYSEPGQQAWYKQRERAEWHSELPIPEVANTDEPRSASTRDGTCGLTHGKSASRVTPNSTDL
ncbi:hypothetical protein LguiA_033648 [Lonicera macranthoides]